MKNECKARKKEELQQKGITLVALVITIIVLLILAGVTIQMATSGEGIFGRAKNAANTYRKSATDENTTLAGHETEIDKTINEFVDGAQEGQGGGTTGGGEQGGGQDVDDGTSLPTATSYVGCYADINGDGVAEGLIYADLALGRTKENKDVHYTGAYPSDEKFPNYLIQYDIPKRTGLKKYKIVNENYKGDFGIHPLITTVENTSGNNRFHIIALKYEKIENSLAKCYFNVKRGETSNSFGSGMANTQKIMNNWKAGEGETDTYKAIKAKVDAGWFIPSLDETAAELGELEYGKKMDDDNMRLNEYDIWSAYVDLGTNVTSSKAERDNDPSNVFGYSNCSEDEECMWVKYDGYFTLYNMKDAGYWGIRLDKEF